MHAWKMVNFGSEIQDNDYHQYRNVKCMKNRNHETFGNTYLTLQWGAENKLAKYWNSLHDYFFHKSRLEFCMHEKIVNFGSEIQDNDYHQYRNVKCMKKRNHETFGNIYLTNRSRQVNFGRKIRAREYHHQMSWFQRV